MSKEKLSAEESLLHTEMHYAFMAHGDGWELDPFMQNIYDLAVTAAKNHAERATEQLQKEREEAVERLMITHNRLISLSSSVPVRDLDEVIRGNEIFLTLNQRSDGKHTLHS